MYAIMIRSFPVWYFLRVVQSESRCLFAFFMLLIHFSYFAFGFGYVLAPFPLLAGKIFFYCFGMSCFVCIVWSCLSIFLVFLLSPVSSDLSLRVETFVLIVLLCFFSFQHIVAFFFCLSIFNRCRSFFICFQSDFPSRLWILVRIL